MSKLTKNQKSVADKVEAGKAYTLKEASELVKEITTTKFDEADNSRKNCYHKYLVLLHQEGSSLDH